MVRKSTAIAGSGLILAAGAALLIPKLGSSTIETDLPTSIRLGSMPDESGRQETSDLDPLEVIPDPRRFGSEQPPSQLPLHDGGSTTVARSSGAMTPDVATSQPALDGQPTPTAKPSTPLPSSPQTTSSAPAPQTVEPEDDDLDDIDSDDTDSDDDDNDSDDDDSDDDDDDDDDDDTDNDNGSQDD